MRMKPQCAINYFVLQNKSQTGMSAHPGERVFVPVLLITDRNVRAPVKFILVCIFMHWPFLSLKRVLFFKIWRISSLKRQLKLVYSIVLMLKRQLQRVDGVVLILKKLLQLVFCHFLNLFLPWKLNIYAISTLKRLKKEVSGLVSNLKRGKILVDIAVLNLKQGNFLKLHGKSILKNDRQQELCPVSKLFLSWNWINIHSC